MTFLRLLIATPFVLIAAAFSGLAVLLADLADWILGNLSR